METREETLQKLYIAQDIIYRAEELTQRYNDTKDKILNLQTFTKIEDLKAPSLTKKIGKTILQFNIGLVIIWFVYRYCEHFSKFFNSLVSFNTISLPRDTKNFIIDTLIVVSVISAGHIIRKMRKKKYARINEQEQMRVNEENEKIMAYNEQINEEVKMINQEMIELRSIADEELYWYPRNYCYSEAVNYFINAIQNFRADCLKEAINLYVEELRHRQLMAQQQQIANQQYEIAKQQKINNVLSTANLFANLGTISAVNQNTTAVNSAAEKSNDTVKKAAEYIRTGRKPW
ncbi:MAG: hypothetical protein ACI4XC_02610 [Eubacterium sp.]